MVYENTDRLEETLSGAGTTLRTSVWILLLKKCQARKTLYGFCVDISTKKNKISVAGQDLISKPGGKI